MSKWNGNKFSIYKSEEKSVLGLLKELGEQSNYNTETLENKTDIFGDHKGSWQGLSRPTMSDEGMRATVEQHIVSINTLENVGVSIEKYGAIGDGKIDCTEAILRALSENDKVFVPKGWFLISNTINIPSGKTLQGVSMKESKLIMKDNINKDMITFVDGEYSALLDICLDHGTQSANNISCILLDDTTATIHDEHYILRNIYIENPSYDGFKLTEQVREVKASNIVIRGKARHNCFTILGTDNYFDNLVAVGSQYYGFEVNGSQNKFVNCKSFWCGNSNSTGVQQGTGLYLNGCNNVQFINFEAQENRGYGLFMNEVRTSQINILLDTNGRKDEGSPNFKIQNCQKNNIDIVSNYRTGLQGKVTYHIETTGSVFDNNFNIQTTSNGKTQFINAVDGIGLFGNNINFNGQKIIFDNAKFKITGTEVIEGYQLMTNGTVSNVEKSVDYINFSQKLKGIGVNQWQGVGIQSQGFNLRSGKITVLLRGFCISGNMEINVLFYNNETPISTEKSSPISESDDNKEVTKITTFNIPSNANKMYLKINAYSVVAGGKFEGYIKDVDFILH